MKNIFLLILLVTTLFGCASHGKYFDYADANRVKNGMTREEVISIMRTKPYRVTPRDFIWSWSKANAFGRVNSRAVTFSFDEDGLTYNIPEEGIMSKVTPYID